jgi:SAM-dependent methyltransferase
MDTKVNELREQETCVPSEPLRETREPLLESCTTSAPRIDHHSWTEHSIVGFWDAIASTDLDERRFGRAACDRLTEIIRPFLNSSDRIIDFGAGSGDLVKKLIDCGYAVAAFETSKIRRSKIRALVSGPKLLGVYGARPTQKFDVVIASEVYEHLLDDEIDAICSDWVETLKPGGRLILTTPCQENLLSGLTICPECTIEFHRKQHMRSVSPDALVERFSNLGLEEIYLGLHDFSATRERYDIYNAYKHAQRHGRLRLEIDKQIKGYLASRGNVQVDGLVDALVDLIDDLLTRNPLPHKRYSAVDGRRTTIVYIGKKCDS